MSGQGSNPKETKEPEEPKEWLGGFPPGVPTVIGMSEKVEDQWPCISLSSCVEEEKKVQPRYGSARA